MPRKCLATLVLSGCEKAAAESAFGQRNGGAVLLRGAPTHGGGVARGQVYRPTRSRGFREEATYREDRVILDEKVARAVRKRTRFGGHIASVIWRGWEFQMLRVLYNAGSDVLKPAAQPWPTTCGSALCGQRSEPPAEGWCRPGLGGRATKGRRGGA